LVNTVAIGILICYPMQFKVAWIEVMVLLVC